MSEESPFRVAIRKFGPFESAIQKIWRNSQATTGTALTLEAVALDLNPLYESLFTRGGLKDGTWDVALIVTDWLAEAVEEGALLDAACEHPDSPVKGKVAIAKLPLEAVLEQTTSVSLSVYWTLVIAAGSRHKDEAYAFVRHACSPQMDKLTTMEGAIGCRLSTWSDPEVNAAIPFYHRLADLTPGARTLPRSRHFPALAHIIDEMAQQAICGAEPSGEILRRAQAKAAHIRL